MKIRAKFENYRKGDLVQYLNNVLEIVSTERATAIGVEKQRRELAEVMEEFNNSWQPSKGSELTPIIQELDDERDSLFVGLKMTVDTWAAHHYEEDKKRAAFLISDKIQIYGNAVQRLRYQQETATINSLLNDITEELDEETKLLGLTEWTNKLKEVNLLFNEKYVERAKAQSSEQEGLVLELRNKSTEAYKKLINLMEARMTIAKAENEDISQYEIVDNELNEITEQYNEAVQMHKNKEEENDAMV